MALTTVHKQHIESAMADPSTSRYVKERLDHSAAVAASTAITNTTTQTAFSLQYTIPANRLTAGSVIKIGYQGITTAQNSSDTLRIIAYIGTAAPTTGTALITTTAVDQVANDIFVGDFNVVVRTIGSAGTLVGYGSASNADAVGTPTSSASVASTAIDTTVAQIIWITATWSVANAGNSCRLDVLNVDVAL